MLINPQIIPLPVQRGIMNSGKDAPLCKNTQINQLLRRNF
jgi:hypothetical protein